MGFGSGLSPKAPGTAGSLLAVGAMVLIVQLPLVLQCLFLVLATMAGIVICQKATDALGVHDHSAIVWDEFVGMWWVLVFVPMGWASWTTAFLLFRLFDILKPWPIGLLDRRLGGGAGVMADDLVAAIFSLIVLAIAHVFWPVLGL